ncbi:hypothetical protein [Luteimonas aquatica]|uniref:hypothetical protein n=1 Tax=Luteimonas aquatica TaxID=450364 RepID=UPI001F59C0EC|nr:hypothetical protein [Luteimonas aquatica]
MGFDEKVYEIAGMALGAFILALILFGKRRMHGEKSGSLLVLLGAFDMIACLAAGLVVERGGVRGVIAESNWRLPGLFGIGMGLVACGGMIWAGSILERRKRRRLGKPGRMA